MSVFLSGTTIGRVSAVDADMDDNAEVSYSILSHWGRDKFSLHPHTGVFTLIGTLDYEEVSITLTYSPWIVDYRALW